MADVKTNRAIKYRIKPNKAQEKLLQQTFGCVRLVYNHYLGERKETYDNNGTSLNYYDNANDLKRLKNELPFLKEVDSISLQQSLRHLDTAYKNFFRDKKVGFPKFKSKKYNHKSYSTVCVNDNIYVDSKYINLPKIGKVKMVCHRPVPDNWVLKSVTVSQEPDEKYYVSVLFEYVTSIKEVPVKTILGLDYSMSSLYVDSDGMFCDYPKFYRQALDRLARQQRKLSKMKKGSNNYYKQRNKLARLHKHISNQRKDFLHKESTEIANRVDAVCIENLDMKKMSQEHAFGKSIADNGWGMFTSYLEYKLRDRGKHYVKIDKFYPSSQICHCCGFRNEETKNLSVRKWKCPKCNNEHDRDVNAAINIRNEGIRFLSI
jgi:putative transposase